MPVFFIKKDPCLLPSTDEEGFTFAACSGSLTSAEENEAICVARQDWEERLRDVACKRFSAYFPLVTCKKM